MSKIYVSPLSAVPDFVRRHKPSHLVTLLGPDTPIVTPEGFAAERHLKLVVHDIHEPAPDFIAPETAHVAELLRFAGTWEQKAPILIHCWAGISRSTAAAYILLCNLNAPGAEAEIARALRHRAPHAQPNRLLVRHADALLGRGGRMIAAVEAMTPARSVWEGELFDLPLTPEELWS